MVGRAFSVKVDFDLHAVSIVDVKISTIQHTLTICIDNYLRLPVQEFGCVPMEKLPYKFICLILV